ncbi:hypothetical protein GTA08_BOTSDO01115 [Neofusicoccum parvum]|nr:hypothetical protein GTA08_BOTSDO01115 [Neofusicoccum parvum]
MVTRATAHPADGEQQPPRVPAVNLPSIHDLNLGSDMAREAAAQPPFAARMPSGLAAQLPSHAHSRPPLPHLPHSHTFSLRPRLPSDSLDQRDRGVVESAAPSPTQGALHTPATPSFPPAQVKDECTRKTSIQQELQKHNKADREKSSRRSLRHEHKKMEIRLQSGGWAAKTDLNSNNKKNSGLDGKKLEILQRTNEEARNKDLLLLNQYNSQQRMLQILMQGKPEMSPDDVAWLRELECEIEAGSRKLVEDLEKEDISIQLYFESEDKKEAEALAKERKGGRYPTPLSSSTSPSPTPTYPHYPM